MQSFILKLQSKIQQRAKNFASLSGLRLVDAGIGLFKDIILTRAFGLGIFLDCYFVATSFLDLCSGYFQHMGYALLLPTYNDQAVSDDRKAPMNETQAKTIVAFLNYMVLAVLGVSIVLVTQMDWIAAQVAPKLKTAETHYLDELMLFAIPISMLFQGSYALRLILVQQKRFQHFYMPGIISSLVFIGLFFLLEPSMHYYAVMWALPVSQIIQFGIYWWVLKLKWGLWFNVPGIGKLLKLSLPSTLVWLSYYLFIPVDNYFLAMLPPGELSAFRYAAKMVSVLGTLTVFTLQMTMLPNMMAAGSRKDYPEMKRYIRQGFKESILVSIPIIVLGFLLAPWGIGLLFEHGAFHKGDTDKVALCLQILLCQLPYVGSWMILSKGFNSLYLVKQSLTVGLIGLVLRIILDKIGMMYWGMAGLAWMTVLQFYLMLLVGLVYLRWLMKRLPPKEVTAT